MKFSTFGEKYTDRSGILQLMDDLGSALAGNEKKYMLGGGNPAIIPEVSAVWRRRMEEILADGTSFDRLVGQYDTPRGRPSFVSSIVDLFNREYGWGISERNVAVTNGSQTGYFILFNMLAGEYSDGRRRKVLFPLLPEYIGYADQSANKADFVALEPAIEQIDEHTHKYHIDFDNLKITDDIAAICVSRPTNPSGNVLTNNEVARLDVIAQENGIPLLIDNAYGTPFPDIIFEPVDPVWNDNIVLSMSLSKIGLPALRTGILIGPPELIDGITSVNAILSLANGGVGQAVAEGLFASGEILELSNDVIRPFYQRKATHARGHIEQVFAERFPYSVHRCEGSLFQWIWFKNLPGTTMDLYERLKARDVVIVPGEYFFYGHDEEWEHKDRCIRVSYAMDDVDVEYGIECIAEEIEVIWRENNAHHLS